MSYSLSQIAQALGLVVEGDATRVVTSVAEPAQARADQLALAMRPDFAKDLKIGAARAAMLWEGADWRGFGLEAAILAPRPRFAMSGLSAMLDPGQGYPQGIDPSAYVDPTASLAENVTVGPMTYVGPGARIGAGTVLGPQVHVGAGVSLGADSLLHTGVRVMAHVQIGARFVAHPGAVVGADGFSFVTPEPSGVEKARASLGGEGTQSAQSWARIHSLGAVTLGDDIELGANSCIDRGTVRDTRVGDGCKFDNQVQIGHNVVIGKDCLICAQVGIAGSSVVGDNVVIGGQSGVSDNIRIGDRAILGGATVALSNVPEGRVMLGYPAMKMDTHIDTYKGLRRLPRLFRDVADLKKAVSKFTSSD